MQHLENIRVLIIHEEPIVVAGLLAVLSTEPGMTVTTASSGSSWQREWAAHGTHCDVLIADYHGALETLADLRKTGRKESRMVPPRVLVVTQLSREWEVRIAMDAGAFGYLMQNCSVAEIVAGVRMVASNRRYLCGAVAERIAESLTRMTLTARETEVLELLQRGMCNKTIARDLGIAPGTVKAHVAGILDKLGATTRTQAVAVATHRGLLRVSAAQPLRRPTSSARVGVGRSDVSGLQELAPATPA